jgi:5-methylcytosine-specific restriction protein A
MSGGFLMGSLIMPQRPLKTCSHPGCNELTRERFCDRHKKQDRKRVDERRGSAHSRGYNYKWQQYREQYLKQHPLCVKCLASGTITVATVVDHIIPHKGDMVLFWDVENHQSLCSRHHNIKTAKEDGGFGIHV